MCAEKSDIYLFPLFSYFKYVYIDEVTFELKDLQKGLPLFTADKGAQFKGVQLFHSEFILTNEQYYVGFLLSLHFFSK